MRWEYDRITTNEPGEHRLYAELDERGREGWELAAVTRADANDGDHDFDVFVFVLKRPLAGAA
jgi:hypothetical protein